MENREDRAAMRARAGSHPVMTQSEREALPDPVGAWWRTWYTKLTKAYEEMAEEFGGTDAAEQAMLSVFPQPIWGFDEDDTKVEAEVEDAYSIYQDETRTLSTAEYVRLVEGYYVAEDEDN